MCVNLSFAVHLQLPFPVQKLTVVVVVSFGFAVAAVVSIATR